jgi:hypothetical protein
MESPFKKANKTVVLYLEPILNKYFKSYQNVITMNCMPDGPLSDMVAMINLTKLSPFQDSGVFSSANFNGSKCNHVLLRYPISQFGGVNWKAADTFMGADDIPSVLSYLQSNGYVINTDLTKMLNKSRVTIGGVSEKYYSGDRKMICIFQKEP